MKVLIVGGGGREHALAWAIAASPLCDALYAAPGNPGIAQLGTCVPLRADDIDGLVAFAKSEGIGFVVIGPELPLILGLADRLAEAGIRAFGPSAAAAALEGSKGFMKDLCARHGIPTAAYRRFTAGEAEAARAWVRARGRPVVVKADGLAAGKGVVVAADEAEALAAIDAALVGDAFGAAGRSIVVEDRLEGPEASFFALSDGETALPLATAQDYKRAYDGDTGPNTGGMGAISPSPLMTPALEATVMERIIRPTLKAMAAEGRPFRGLLYAGLMLTAEGPMLLEYNVRFGDPETQALVVRLASDLLPALIACSEGELAHLTLRWHPTPSCCVVLAQKGYPGPFTPGSEIRGLEEAAKVQGVQVFHAGTRAGPGGAVLAEGGRVLAVVGRSKTSADARAAAYQSVDVVKWPMGRCRTDIAALGSELSLGQKPRTCDLAARH